VGSLGVSAIALSVPPPHDEVLAARAAAGVLGVSV
jgi:hypothetical protein